MTISPFLSDLYEIDPALKAHEAELIPLLERLLKSDPAQEPSPAFVAKLRKQLRARAQEISRDSSAAFSASAASSSFSSTSSTSSPMSRLMSAFLGAFAALVIAVPVTYIALSSPVPDAQRSSSPLFSYGVTETSHEAFGDLATVSLATGMGGRGGAGGGGGAPAMDMAREKIGLVAPDAVQHRYVFEGELPPLTEETVAVLRRQISAGSVSLSSVASQFNVGPIDLSSFGNATVDNVTFTQNIDRGYMVNVSLRDGQVSINANWEKWPRLDAECTTDECYQRYRVKIDEIPADSALIAIANAFAKKHGIDLTAYGEPDVDKTWRRDYERAADTMLAYIPESQRVIYPLLIEGKAVYDQSGITMGLSIGVDVREKQVMDVWGIMDRRYLKSDYAGVTDPQAIQTFLANLDKYPTEFLPEDTQVRTVDVKLGAPELAYATAYVYDGFRSDELLVPSLIFPIESMPEDTYLYRQTVVVPLAEKMLEQASIQPPMHILEGVR